GGDALNVAMGLAKLGVAVDVAGRVAADANGSFIRAECEKAGIGGKNIVNDSFCATVTSFALIDTSGERHFLTDKAIFEKLTAADIPDTALPKAGIVYFGSDMAFPAMDGGGTAGLFKMALGLGSLTVMDAALNEAAAVNWRAVLSGALHNTDIFFPSLAEATAITGKTELPQIAQQFRQYGMKAFGVKLGAKGCYITNFNDEAYFPALQGLPVVDTTGAGDSFMAAFICGLVHGWNIFECAEFANTVAAQNVGAVGGTAGIPGFDDAFAFYQSRKTITGPKA
ncbi:MAG: carbohydrate kinase family protein, partial [Oscillospiraceae bacterium]